MIAKVLFIYSLGLGLWDALRRRPYLKQRIEFVMYMREERKYAARVDRMVREIEKLAKWSRRLGLGG